MLGFLSCSHSTLLDLQSLSTDLTRCEVDDQTKLIQKKGIEHERRFLDSLVQRGVRVAACSPMERSNLHELIAATDRALQSGAEVVYQPYFNDGTFHGYADFLLRVDKGSALGAFSYEVADAKVSSKEKPYFILQLCLYSELLGQIQGRLPEFVHVILGTNERKSYRVADYFFYFLKVKERFLEFLKERELFERSYPEPTSHCSVCHWRELCKERWKRDDHLCQVANIRKSQTKRLNDAGINTMTALVKSLCENVGIATDAVKRLQLQASLQLQKKETGSNNYVLQSEGPGKGFALLPEPAAGDLFYDIEGDPLLREAALLNENAALRAGLEYLHGVVWKEETGELSFRPFWALAKSDEKRCFEELIDFFQDHFKRYPGAHIYHYSPYETAALKRLVCQYGTRSEAVDALLRSKRFIDLYKVVRQSLIVSEPKYSIKNLECFYMEKRQQELKSGGSSVVWFEEYLETGEQRLLDEIEEYNKVDCISTYELREWLLARKREAEERFGPFPRVEEAREEEAESVEVDEEIARYHRILCSSLPEDEELFSKEDRVKLLLFQLLDFHRREMKPVFWEFYSRLEKTTVELIDDDGALGGLELVEEIPPKRKGGCPLLRYGFPKQDTKLRVGDAVYDTDSGRRFGTIEELDLDGGIVTVKRMGKRETMSSLSLIPLDMVDDSLLRGALRRFAERVIEEGSLDNDTPSRYSALVDILFRRKPRRGEGDASSVVTLEESYLFIQGPPGTGKTYTGARLIVDLLERGKKVGVTALSHKAINNLLREVEVVAVERRVSFVGLKKSDKGDVAKAFLDGHYILNEDKGDLFDRGEYDLIAGTAWLFSREALDQRLDYLFVDEAGQMSLPNLIAAGVSAKNIVLLGDPMQLPQPLKGMHPGESGLSPLEYLLEGRATVSDDTGLFLSTSYRMPPAICRFLSEHVYEGRLRSPETASRQRILHPDPLLSGAGLRFIPVIHEGNSTVCEEECDRIVHLYNDLLREGCFQDQRSGKVDLTCDDIMVVAPFNLQVDRLKRALGTDARVGTIDLFQGQEAPVLILSMTASRGEEMPRGIEFLFSKQRLNVALSRAKALALVVGSPDLFSTRCSTPHQVALVNLLCALDTPVSP